MDFHGMKRKQLQALCKKHGIPANLKNLEMADQLTSILKENEEPISKENFSLKNSAEIGSNDGPEIEGPKVKKVRFSPENQIFEYTRSVKKRAGRRGKVESKVLVAEAGKVSRRSSRNVAKDNAEDTQKPHVVSKISGNADSGETQAPLRRSTRNASKRDLVARVPAKAVEKKKRNRSGMPIAEEEDSLTESIEMQTEYAWLVNPEAAGPVLVDKDLSLVEPTVLEDSDKHGQVSGISCKKLSSFMDRQSVGSKTHKKWKEFYSNHNDGKNVLKEEIQVESLPKFSLEELRDGMVGETPDRDNVSVENLCSFSSEDNSATEQVEVKVCTKSHGNKESPFEEMTAPCAYELASEKIRGVSELLEERNCCVENVVSNEAEDTILNIEELKFDLKGTKEDVLELGRNASIVSNNLMLGDGKAADVGNKDYFDAAPYVTSSDIGDFLVEEELLGGKDNDQNVVSNPVHQNSRAEEDKADMNFMAVNICSENIVNSSNLVVRTLTSSKIFESGGKLDEINIVEGDKFKTYGQSSVVSNDVDKKKLAYERVIEEQLSEQGHLSHLAFKDKAICDDGEGLDKQGTLFVDKGMSLVEPSVLKDSNKPGQAFGISNNTVSSFKGRQSVVSKTEEKCKEFYSNNDDGKNVLKEKIQVGALPQFSMVELQDGMKGETKDGDNVSGENLCSFSSEGSITTEHVEVKSCTKSNGNKASKFEEMTAPRAYELASEEIHDVSELLGETTCCVENVVPNEAEDTIVKIEEVKFDLKGTREGAIEMSRNVSIVSNNLMLGDGKVADVGKKVYLDASTHVTSSDIGDFLVEEEKLRLKDSDQNFVSNNAHKNSRAKGDETDVVPMAVNICFEDIVNGSKLDERSPTCFQNFECGRKLDEINVAECKLSAHASSGNKFNSDVQSSCVVSNSADRKKLAYVLVIGEVDQKIAEEQLSEQGHHYNLAFEDKPICDDGEGFNKQGDVSTINQENTDSEIYKDNDKLGQFSGIGNNNLSSFKGRQSVASKTEEKCKELYSNHDDGKNVLKEEIQVESLPRFSMVVFQDGMEGETKDGDNVSGVNLYSFSSEDIITGELVEVKVCTKSNGYKASQFKEMTAPCTYELASEEIHDVSELLGERSCEKVVPYEAEDTTMKIEEVKFNLKCTKEGALELSRNVSIVSKDFMLGDGKVADVEKKVYIDASPHVTSSDICDFLVKDKILGVKDNDQNIVSHHVHKSSRAKGDEIDVVPMAVNSCSEDIVNSSKLVERSPTCSKNFDSGRKLNNHASSDAGDKFKSYVRSSVISNYADRKQLAYEMIIGEVDQQIAEEQLSEQGHHSNFVFEDNPICDDGEGLDKQGDVFAINQENADSEIYKDSDKHGHVSGISDNKLSSCMSRQSVAIKTQEKCNELHSNHDYGKNVLKEDIQVKSLPQFSMVKLQHGMEGETRVGDNVSGLNLCSLSSEDSITREQVEVKVCTKSNGNKASQFEEMTAPCTYELTSEEIHDISGLLAERTCENVVPNEAEVTIMKIEEVKFKLKGTKEGALELGRNVSIVSNNLMLGDEKVADVEKKVYLNASPHITSCDICDFLVVDEILGVKDSDQNVISHHVHKSSRAKGDEIDVLPMAVNSCPEDIVNSSKLVEGSPTCSKKFESGRKLDEVYISEGKLCAHASSVKTETDSDAGDKFKSYVQIAEEKLSEQGHHSNFAFEDNPMCDNFEGLDKQDDVSTINQENALSEIYKDCDKHGQVSGISENILSSFKDRQSVGSKTREKWKELYSNHNDGKNVLKEEIQVESLPQFFVEELHDGMEGETLDEDNVSVENLCSFSSEDSSAREQEVKVCTKSNSNKESPFEKMTAPFTYKFASEEIHDVSLLLGERTCCVENVVPNEAEDTIMKIEEVIFDLKGTKEGALELGRKASIVSNDLMLGDGKVVDVGKKVYLDVSPHVTSGDIYDFLIEEELLGVKDSDQNVVSNHSVNGDETDVVPMAVNTCSESIVNSSKLFERTPSCSKNFMNGRKLDEMNIEEGKSCSDASSGKTETYSSSVVLSELKASSSYGDKFKSYVQSSVVSKDAERKKLAFELLVEDVDQQIAEPQLSEQEHHSHLAFKDKPICDDGEGSDKQDNVSSINQEYADSDIYKESDKYGQAVSGICDNKLSSSKGSQLMVSKTQEKWKELYSIHDDGKNVLKGGIQDGKDNVSCENLCSFSSEDSSEREQVDVEACTKSNGYEASLFEEMTAPCTNEFASEEFYDLSELLEERTCCFENVVPNEAKDTILKIVGISIDAGQKVMTGEDREECNPIYSMDPSIDDVSRKEGNPCLFEKQLHSSMRERKLFQKTTMLHSTHDMKENAPSNKVEEIGNLTAPKTSKRRPLEDLGRIIR